MTTHIVPAAGNLSIVGQSVSGLLWPDHVKVFRVDGDGMYPTLCDGDYVVVDTREREMKEGVFVLLFGESVGIRRLQPLPGRKFLLGTDNAAYPKMEVEASSLAGDVLVGRVIFAEKRFY